MIDKKKLIEAIVNNPTKDCDKFSSWVFQNGYLNGSATRQNEIIDIINAQPQADKWIPCEERLPEKYGDYLVAIIPKAGVLWQRIMIARYSDLMGICVQPSFHIGEVGKDSFEKLEGVVAWQPLPQPYKKEGNSNEDI